MDKPKLFVCNKLVKHFLTSEKKLKEIQSKIDSNQDELISDGLFILAVASFENTLTDTLAYFLQKFPEKISKNKFEITKDLVIEVGYLKNIINDIVDREINNLAYKPIKEILQEYVNYFAIDALSDNHKLGLLNEIKETRNLLLHNNLKVNATYLLKTGEFAREKEENKKLKLNAKYIKEAINVLNEFLDNIKASIIKKYQEYTYIKAVENLWYFMFHSDVMKFKDYWDIDTQKDEITALTHCKYEPALSTGETTLLSLWRMLFTGHTEIKNFDYYHLDVYNRQKVNLLFELASDYWFWAGEYTS